MSPPPVGGCHGTGLLVREREILDARTAALEGGLRGRLSDEECCGGGRFSPWL